MAFGTRPRYLSPSAILFRKSIRSGFAGDSQAWKVIGMTILGYRLLRRVMGSEPRTIAVERIRPGETVILRGVRSRDIPPP